MECQTYYQECTKFSNPDRRKKLFGTWRKKYPIGVKCDKYVEVGRFADFLVGVYIIQKNPSEHKRILGLKLNDMSVDLLPVTELNWEDLRYDDKALKGKNCLPEPLPITRLMYSAIRICMDYSKVDKRYMTVNDCQILLVYDYTDESYDRTESPLKWQELFIYRGVAALL